MKVIDKHRAVILKANPKQIRAVIPHAKSVEVRGKQFVAVKHGMEESVVLRNMGYAVPSPILHYYEWPRSAEITNPFQAQLATAAFLTLNRRAYVLNGLGSGKTQATLWAYDYLRSQHRAVKMLVVAPLSTLELTWAQALFDHFPHLSFMVVHAARAKRLQMINEDVDIYITNHDGVKIIQDKLATRFDITHVVVDEIAQCARNAKTDRWKALNSVVNKQLPRACWGLTATPTPNEPTDAWAQCRLVTPETVPRTFTRFRDQVMRQVGPYLWLPREGATDTVHEVMQPAIRFSREECVDLPPTTFAEHHVPLSKEQEVAYKLMESTLKAEIDTGEVTAVNEAVKANKLVQIACLSGDTEVLTMRGWVGIIDVRKGDRVWDGIEWVHTDGVVCNGSRPVVTCDGVRMTADHKVLTVSGWYEAGEIIGGSDGHGSSGLDRKEVRLPDGHAASRVNNGQDQMRDMAVSMRLRDVRRAGKPESAEDKPPQWTELRMWSRGVEQDTRGDTAPAVQHMEPHEIPMPLAAQQRLVQLRWSWGRSLRSLGEVIRRFLGGYGAGVCGRFDVGPQGQRRTLLTGELPVGDTPTAKPEPPIDYLGRDTTGDDGSFGSGEAAQPKTRNSVCPTAERVGSGRSPHNPATEAVYDLINCGPRSRFVVRGDGNEPIIVHNCGVVYDKGHEVLELPNKARVQETLDLIQDSASAVIVFVPFVSAVEYVAQKIRDAGYSVGVVHGGVSKRQRDEIFNDFQRERTLDVIVAQPAAMSHGLTLTAASTIIWYAPITSADIFEQANGRITRPSQKHNTLIAMISGTTVERKMYTRLKNKQKMQNLLLDRVVGSREA